MKSPAVIKSTFICSPMQFDRITRKRDLGVELPKFLDGLHLIADHACKNTIGYIFDHKGTMSTVPLQENEPLTPKDWGDWDE